MLYSKANERGYKKNDSSDVYHRVLRGLSDFFVNSKEVDDSMHSVMILQIVVKYLIKY